MTTPTGGDTTGAAILALLIILGGRAIDYFLPKGWHLKVLRRWAEPDKEDDDAT